MKSKITTIFLTLLLFLLIPYVAEAGVAVIMGGLTHERKAQRGDSYQGVIFIRNPGENRQEVRVYQTDYLFFFDGRSIYGEPGKTPRSNAKWITFSPKRLTILPQGVSRVNYTVNVPDETLVGTYWSMLMVEGISEGSPQSGRPEKGTVALGIRQVMRYGIQMVSHLGNTGARRLKFLKTKLLKEEEKRTLQVDIENIGERWLRPFLWAELYDEKGIFIGRFEGGRMRIYPGTSVRYRVDLTEVPKGKYKALVVADGGGEDIFGITYTLEFEK